MEELGIGRPSTYATTLNVLRDREYVRLDKKRLYPEDKGRLVTAFLESFFRRYVEYDFTADLEEKLDQISAGKLEWKDVLRDFWREFIAAVNDIGELRIAHVLDALNDLLGPHIFPEPAEGGDPRGCPSCGVGRLSLKVGKFGAFIGCSNYPECRYTRQLAETGDKAPPAEAKVLGTDPETGLDVTLRTGRFGPYVQLGEGNGKEKPKRASIPKGTDPESLELDRALALLALPREVGAHPETGKPILAGFGRYGPYVQHDGKYASLSAPEEVFEVGHQPRREPARREGRQSPAARRERHQGARRSSRARRQGPGAVRPLRSIREAWQGQRHAAQGHRARADHARAGGRADCRAKHERLRQEAG